jgi:hypothetical protein
MALSRRDAYDNSSLDSAYLSSTPDEVSRDGDFGGSSRAVTPTLPPKRPKVYSSGIQPTLTRYFRRNSSTSSAEPPIILVDEGHASDEQPSADVANAEAGLPLRVPSARPLNVFGGKTKKTPAQAVSAVSRKLLDATAALRPKKGRTLLDYVQQETPATNTALAIVKEMGSSFNPEQQLVLLTILNMQNFCVFGPPGTGKTHTIVALDIPDTAIFTYTGAAADSAFEEYRLARKMSVMEAKIHMAENNVVISHFDRFYAIMPHMHSFTDWEQSLQRLVRERLDAYYDTRPRMFMLDEAPIIGERRLRLLEAIDDYFETRAYHRRRKVEKTLPAKFPRRWFAGKAIGLIGDPMQIVPLKPRLSKTDPRVPDHIMETDVFRLNIPEATQLCLFRQKRQQDSAYKVVLEDFRSGKLSERGMAVLRSLVVKPNPTPEDGQIIVFYRTVMHYHNLRFLRQLPSQERVFKPIVMRDANFKATRAKKGETRTEEEEICESAEWVTVDRERDPVMFDHIMELRTSDSDCQADAKKNLPEYMDVVILRVGAPVVYRLNHPTFDQWRNGTRAYIVDFDKAGYPIICLRSLVEARRDAIDALGGDVDDPSVYFPDDLKTGVALTVKYFTARHIGNLQTNKAKGAPPKYSSYKISYMPLLLDWAATVHRLMGATRENCVIDATAKPFMKGMRNVLFSRGKNPPAVLKPIDETFELDNDDVAIAYNNKLKDSMRQKCIDSGIDVDAYDGDDE